MNTRVKTRWEKSVCNFPIRKECRHYWRRQQARLSLLTSIYDMGHYHRQTRCTQLQKGGRTERIY